MGTSNSKEQHTSANYNQNSSNSYPTAQVSQHLRNQGCYFFCYVMPKNTFLALPKIPSFETALLNGWIVPYTGGILLFLSHRWLQENRPDHDNFKLCGSKSMLENCELEEVEYIWMDYFSIPQDETNEEDQQRAIDSLPYYVRQCSHFVMLTATNSGVSVTDEKVRIARSRAEWVVYESRGWCRLERFAAASPVCENGKRIRDIKSWKYDMSRHELSTSPFSFSTKGSRNPLEGVFFGEDKEITRIIPMVLRLCTYVDNNSGEELLRNISRNIRMTAEQHHTLPLALQQQAVRSMQETYGANAAWKRVLSCLDPCTLLTKIDFHGAGLSGSIPPELGQLTGLTELSLHSNKLTGSIPPELGQLTGLTKLYLGANKLTGSIPPELGRLTGLTELSLGGNSLTGSIPPELGQLTGLTWLRLNNNSLTGVLPNGLRGVRGLYISGNAGLKKS